MNVSSKKLYLILGALAGMALLLMAGCGGEDPAPIQPTPPPPIVSSGGSNNFGGSGSFGSVGNCGSASGNFNGFQIPAASGDLYPTNTQPTYQMNRIAGLSIAPVTQPIFGAQSAQVNARAQFIFSDIQYYVGGGNSGIGNQNFVPNNCFNSQFPGDMFVGQNGFNYYRGTISGFLPVQGGIGFQGQQGQVPVEVLITGQSCQQNDAALLANGRLTGCAIITYGSSNGVYQPYPQPGYGSQGSTLFYSIQ